MQIYLDTGNIDEIKAGVATGAVDGVTTNPSLIAKEGRDFEKTVKEIAAILEKSGKKHFTVSAEVTALTAPEMIKQGLKLAKLHKNVLVKVPLTEEGIKATAALAKQKIRVNVTLCFSANQALLAAKAGAFVVSPFLGRLDDIGHDGMELIEEIREIYDNYEYKTGILAASIRSPLHVKNAALAGADLATIPYKVFQQLFNHPLTTSGLDKFMKDWKAYEERK